LEVLDVDGDDGGRAGSVVVVLTTDAALHELLVRSGKTIKK
jgi:hypothetical protein